MNAAFCFSLGVDEEMDMRVTKLRPPVDENGFVPVGTYFERLAAALREANERAGNFETPRPRRVARMRDDAREHMHSAR